MPAVGLSAAKAGLGALYEEVALEFRHRIDHVHGELARRAGEIDTAERQAVNLDAGLGEACHRGGDIHGVAPEAVELGDDQDISGLEPVGEPCEFRPLADGDTSRDGFGDDAVRLDPEARSGDFLHLVFGCLLGCGDPEICEGSCHCPACPQTLSAS